MFTLEILSKQRVAPTLVWPGKYFKNGSLPDVVSTEFLNLGETLNRTAERTVAVEYTFIHTDYSNLTVASLNSQRG